MRHRFIYTKAASTLPWWAFTGEKFNLRTYGRNSLDKREILEAEIPNGILGRFELVRRVRAIDLIATPLAYQLLPKWAQKST